MTQSIVDVVVDAAQKAGGFPVRSIELVIGEMSSIVDDSVQFYFDILSEGTLAHGALLQFRREPAQLTCWDCGLEAPVVAPLPTECPRCNSRKLMVGGGQAFRIESIEVDDESTSSQIDSDE